MNETWRAYKLSRLLIERENLIHSRFRELPAVQDRRRLDRHRR
jgi:hypothetical protein